MRRFGLSPKQWQFLSGLLDRNLPGLFKRIRHREFPDVYIPEVVQLENQKKRHRAFSTTYRDHLLTTSELAVAGEKRISLSYMPVSKNVRQLATALYHSGDSGHTIRIGHGNPREEHSFERENKGDWQPWLWGRIPRTSEPLADPRSAMQDLNPTERLWLLWFQNLPGQIASTGDSLQPTGQAIHTPATDIRPAQVKILKMSCCCARVFCLNDYVIGKIEDWGQQMEWTADEPSLGIHIRRGDAVSENLSKSTRPGHSLETYLAAADQMCAKYDLQTIYLSTESQEIIDRARALRPDYRFLSLPHDREIFPTIESGGKFIEETALDYPELIELLVLSALADLYFLQQSDAFIGTFNSEFSMLAWLLCVGQNGHIVPFQDLTTLNQMHSYQGNLDFWMDSPE